MTASILAPLLAPARPVEPVDQLALRSRSRRRRRFMIVEYQRVQVFGAPARAGHRDSRCPTLISACRRSWRRRRSLVRPSPSRARPSARCAARRAARRARLQNGAAPVVLQRGLVGDALVVSPSSYIDMTAIAVELFDLVEAPAAGPRRLVLELRLGRAAVRSGGAGPRRGRDVARRHAVLLDQPSAEVEHALVGAVEVPRGLPPVSRPCWISTR